MIKKLSGAIFGFTVADALGVPYEFSTREERNNNPVTGMTGGGYWDQSPGTWSDDSSMVFCTLESLRVGFDTDDLGRRFHRWCFENYWTPHGEVFDVGGQTRNALERIDAIIAYGETITPMPPSMAKVRENGNGSLMRILPLAFYLLRLPIEQHYLVIRDASALTHPHVRSIIACYIYTEMAIALLEDQSPDQALRTANILARQHTPLEQRVPEMNAYMRILTGNPGKWQRDEIRSGGYVVDSLEACLWTLFNSQDYGETVLKAVNLGGDTDTIAALAGGLAGIIYGYDRIPQNWLKLLVRRGDIERLLINSKKNLGILD